jgi:hypothetical protein
MVPSFQHALMTEILEEEAEEAEMEFHLQWR